LCASWLCGKKNSGKIISHKGTKTTKKKLEAAHLCALCGFVGKKSAGKQIHTKTQRPLRKILDQTTFVRFVALWEKISGK
jgi:hypothetical protein